MGRLIANMDLTLDGVMHAPGRADEDTRGGFVHGGWATLYFGPTSEVVRIPMRRMGSTPGPVT
jgi:hypothetical protein